MKWSTAMVVAMWIGLVSLVVGIIIRLQVVPPFPVGLLPRAYLQFTIACFLFAILAGLFRIMRTKGQ